MNKAILAGAAALAAAGALAVPAGVSTVHRDVALTAADPADAFTTDMTAFYQALNELLGLPGGLLQATTTELDSLLHDGGFLTDDVLIPQLGALLPSGMLDADEVGGSFSGPEAGAESALASGVVASPWTTDLANALNMGSAASDLTAAAGLLPNGVNFLFDQLAVDGINLSGGDAEPIFAPVGLGGALLDLDPSLATELTALAGAQGDLAATFIDLLGVI